MEKLARQKLNFPIINFYQSELQIESFIIYFSFQWKKMQNQVLFISMIQ